MGRHLDSEMALMSGMIFGTLLKYKELFAEVSEFELGVDGDGDYTGELLIHRKDYRTFRLKLIDDDAARGFVSAKDEIVTLRRSLAEPLDSPA